MPSSLKNELSLSDFEVEAQDLQLQSKLQSELQSELQSQRHRLISIVHGSRLALTALALAAGVAVLGVSANGLLVYRQTHLPDDFYLALWPSRFDLRPTAALVASGVVVVVSSIVSLLLGKIQAVPSALTFLVETQLHGLAGPRAVASLAAPAAGFVASLVAMALFYAVNASSTVDGLQSWSCRWSNVPMTVQPHFGALCKQSQAGVLLAVLLVPLEAAIVGVAGYQAILERQAERDRISHPTHKGR
ncbi:hypothetical protein Trco_007711 [Trichoderma cornu-damae]|uniref:Uncharacterized protein n=1 Tax=Trichoderma cornu-damae TaxID=654480 RepID=A0A9P8QEM9_9HYPO|nr:hypothetical protein Trco_007711 [Trichoderma cornu-damae]